MPLCSSCSAPLPVNTCRCGYCGTRNDMNFSAVGRFSVDDQPSRRLCPDCAVVLKTVRVDTGAGLFAVERCEGCFGLFFDVGEVKAFLDAAVSPAFTFDLREITTINEERASFSRPVRYVRCPECGVLMNRVNYGARSGVVVDQCKDHGMWLNNGELVHLMEWKKAGGQLLAQKEKLAPEQRQRENQRPLFSSAGTVQEEPAGDIISAVCSGLLDILCR